MLPLLDCHPDTTEGAVMIVSVKALSIEICLAADVVPSFAGYWFSIVASKYGMLLKSQCCANCHLS